MKILVTGANGLLGQRLVKLCLDTGVDVIATSVGASRLYQLEGTSFETLDITDKNAVAAALEKHRPDAVVNTAALTHVDACENNKEQAKAINITAVQYLADLCAERNMYLCHISTDFIFDGEQGMYTETDTPNPVNFYGETKLEAEKILRAHPTVKASILRTILVYGFVPNLTRTNIILWLNDTLGAGNPVKMVTDQFRMPTFADDLAKACLLACQKQAEGVFNVSGPEYLSVYDLALLVADIFGHNKELVTPATSVAFSDKAPRPPKTGFNLDKSRAELDYNPLPLKDALQQTHLQIQDFKNNNPA